MPSHDYVLRRSTTDDAYGLYRLDLEAPELLVEVPLAAGASFPKDDTLVWIGGYFLSWSAVHDPKTQDPWYAYRLFPFDPSSPDPLAAPDLQSGKWLKHKFWGRAADFGNPTGGHDQYDEENVLTLLPLGTFLLNWIPTDGRGTFAVWNFDPAPTKPGASDPIPGDYPYIAQGSFRSMQTGDELLPLNDYVLDRKPDGSSFALWSFDPQAIIPLAHPAVQQGRWKDIDARHRLVPVGDHVLDWVPGERRFRLWRFDPNAESVLVGPVREGALPESLSATDVLYGFAPNRPIDAARASTPGTIEFLRSKIEHVVYYMLENRSFDHAVGWLYEHDPEKIRVIGPPGPYRGASTELWNPSGEKRVHVSKYRDGKLSTEWPLEVFTWDPYHDMSDVLRQLFYEDVDGYAKRATPDMRGFIWNNGSEEVMETFSPEQLPVLNGIAKHFAISDEWFCSMPSATDVNRAFALTGSAELQLNNFMSPPQYDYWPEQPHRASIFKVLWANGFTDWKIYNSTTWQNYVFTYQLFLEGQIPTVDANPSGWVQPIDQFYADAKAGTLPRFSYLEPVWIGSSGTTSYHPGEDIVPAERQLNAIYDAIRTGPKWDRTLLVVTFDEHGGIFDHVPPPYAERPWPNDVMDGFRYDLMGPRVPTILASPWIEEHTVFRSETDVAYDSTSILATLLEWYGIPRSRWFLGARTSHAPTFEGVVRRESPRATSPAFTPPYDSQYPPDGTARPSGRVTGLQRMILPRMIWSMARGKLPDGEIRALCRDLDEKAKDLPTLMGLLEELKARLG